MGKAMRMSDLSLLSLIMAMLWTAARAQSGCTTAVMSLSPCLSFVRGSSSTPSSSCCSQLANVVQGQPQCLCALAKGGAPIPGITINQTLALALPGACNVKTPPVSQCDAVNGPASAPAPAFNGPTSSPSPSNSPGALPGAPTASSSPAIQSGTGSKQVPGGNGAAVGGSSRSIAFSAVGIFLLVASSTSWAVLDF